MTNYNGLISFPNLVDSSVSSSITTLNNDLINPKERNAMISLTLEDKVSLEEITMMCDYPTLVNLNYKLKSMLQQIENSVRSINK